MEDSSRLKDTAEGRFFMWDSRQKYCTMPYLPNLENWASCYPRQGLRMGEQLQPSILCFSYSSYRRKRLSFYSFCSSHSLFRVATSKVQLDICSNDFLDRLGLKEGTSYSSSGHKVFSLRGRLNSSMRCRLGLELLLLTGWQGFLLPFCWPDVASLSSTFFVLRTIYCDFFNIFGLKVHQSEFLFDYMASPLLSPLLNLLSPSIRNLFPFSYLLVMTCSQQFQSICMLVPLSQALIQLWRLFRLSLTVLFSVTPDQSYMLRQLRRLCQALSQGWGIFLVALGGRLLMEATDLLFFVWRGLFLIV